MFYVYLLLSVKYGKLYIGQTRNLLQRFEYHNNNRSGFTKNKGPWVLVAFKRFDTRGEAMAEENRLKKLKNKQRIFEEFGLNLNDFIQLLFFNKKTWYSPISWQPKV